MTPEEAIQFGKEQLEIFGKDSDMYAFIDIAIKALEERPKGEWVFMYEIFDTRLFKCTHCNTSTALMPNQHIELFHYCSNCGAEMRGDV